MAELVIKQELINSENAETLKKNMSLRCYFL